MAMAWTRDGKRLAYAADWEATERPVEGVPQVPVVVGADSSTKRAGLLPEDRGAMIGS